MNTDLLFIILLLRQEKYVEPDILFLMRTHTPPQKAPHLKFCIRSGFS